MNPSESWLKDHEKDANRWSNRNLSSSLASLSVHWGGSRAMLLASRLVPLLRRVCITTKGHHTWNLLSLFPSQQQGSVHSRHQVQDWPSSNKAVRSAEKHGGLLERSKRRDCAVWKSCLLVMISTCIYYSRIHISWNTISFAASGMSLHFCKTSSIVLSLISPSVTDP